MIIIRGIPIFILITALVLMERTIKDLLEGVKEKQKKINYRRLKTVAYDSNGYPIVVEVN